MQPELVYEARDRAMSSVAVNAERPTSGFGDRARAYVLAYLEANGPASGERLTLACKAAGLRPHDDRAFGPVYFSLLRRGLIRQVGEAVRLRGHGTGGGRVWGLA